MKMKCVSVIILIFTLLFLSSGCGNKSNATPNNKEEQIFADSIDTWEYMIPKRFDRVKDDDSPWYEKNYKDNSNATLHIGYYEPQGVDEREDWQIFEESLDEFIKEIEYKHKGTIEFKNVEAKNHMYTIYFRDSQLKTLTRAAISDETWKVVMINIPIDLDTEEYESILDVIK